MIRLIRPTRISSQGCWRNALALAKGYSPILPWIFTPTQSYSSVQGDTCESIEKMFALPGASILAANSFLTCSDI